MLILPSVFEHNKDTGWLKLLIQQQLSHFFTTPKVAC